MSDRYLEHRVTVAMAYARGRVRNDDVPVQLAADDALQVFEIPPEHRRRVLDLIVKDCAAIVAGKRREDTDE